MAAFLLTNESPLELQTKREDNRAYLTLCVLLGIPAIAAAAYFDGIGIWLVVVALVLAAVYVEPRFGLYMVILAAAIDVVPYDPIMVSFARLGIPLPAAHATPVELLFAWTFICWLLKSSRDGVWSFPNQTAVISGSVFGLCLMLATIHGLFQGGNSTIALWETRVLFNIIPLMFVAAGLLTERRHVIEYIAIVVISQTLMSFEELWRYLVIIRPVISNPGQLITQSVPGLTGPVTIVPEAAFNHDGAVLVASIAVVCAAVLIWSKDLRWDALAIVVMAASIFVVLGSRRRASIVGAEVGMVVLAGVLLMTNFKRFALLAPIAAVVGVLYIGAFWNSSNSLGQPARAFRSVFESSSASARDQSSDNYRKVEASDLWIGIKANPITGVGYGVPFPKPLPLQDLSKHWPFWAYIPHNNILWLWSKGGIFTFMAFWYFLGTSIANAISFVRHQRDPALIGIVATIVAFYVMVVMFAWVDLGLTSPRLLVIFGTSLGLLSVIERVWWKGRPSVEQEIGANASA